MKALVGAFNQEKALVGAFSVIVKTDCGTDGALHSSTLYSLTAETGWCWRRGRRLKSSRLCELCWETLAAAVSWADGMVELRWWGRARAQTAVKSLN